MNYSNVRTAFDLFCSVMQNAVQQHLGPRCSDSEQRAGVSKELTRQIVEMAQFTGEAFADGIEDDDNRMNAE